MESRDPQQITIIENGPPTKRQKLQENEEIASGQDQRVHEPYLFLSKENLISEMQCPVCFSIVCKKTFVLPRRTPALLRLPTQVDPLFHLSFQANQLPKHYYGKASATNPPKAVNCM